MQYEKGFQVLVRAMGLLRHSHDDLRCIIGGTGGYLAELQSRIDLDRVADRVELAGFLTDEELLDTLHRASCVVIPSLYEPFGIVALEALAGGAPLVVAETGGLAELVRSTEAGLMFEPGDAEQLASCIARILDEPELAQRLGDHASAMLTERYSWETIATSTVEWYEATRTRHRRSLTSRTRASSAISARVGVLLLTRATGASGPDGDVITSRDSVCSHIVGSVGIRRTRRVLSLAQPTMRYR
ncbi:MAG: glycosyltransferase family 4 protein [Ilumatobacteraceae bacterium]